MYYTKLVSFIGIPFTAFFLDYQRAAGGRGKISHEKVPEVL